MTTLTLAGRDLAIPTPRSFWHLVLAGFAALGFYEVWASWPTHLFAGFPLEPPELVKLLFERRLGWKLSPVTCKALHYLTGFVFYPLGYWVVSRWIKSFGPKLDGWVWGVITYFIALGFFAPLAGLPFLLIGDNERLSLMSLIGHAIYGWVLGRVFEKLEQPD